MNTKLSEKRYEKKLTRMVKRIFNLKKREPEKMASMLLPDASREQVDDGEPKGIRDSGTGKVLNISKIKINNQSKFSYVDAEGQTQLVTNNRTFSEIIARIIELNWKEA